MASNQLKSRQKQDYPYRLDYRTRWSDNDMYNHMNNSVYSFLFDSIINAYLIEYCGLDPPNSSQIGLVVHSQCDYFGSVAYPGTVQLGMRVTALGKSSATYEVGVFDQDTEDAKAVGGFTHVFVERSSNRPSTSGMSPELRAGLSRLITQTSSKL